MRNPLEVMASLRHRDGFLPAKSALLWLRHVIDAEASTRDMPRAVVTYDALLSDWQGVVASLGAGLGVSWPRRSAVADVEIDRFLATQLRHHVVSPERLAARSDVAEWVKEAHAALLKMSEAPEHAASMSKLDRIRAEFERASSAFGVALSEGEQELAKRDMENAQLRADSGALVQRLADVSDERQRHTAEAEDAAAELRKQLEGAHTAEQQRVAEQQAAVIAVLQSEGAEAQAGRAVAIEESQRAWAAHDVLKGKLDHAHAALSAERQRTAERADQITDLERVRDSAEGLRVAAMAEVGQLRAELGVHARIAAEQAVMISYLQAIEVRSQQEGVASKSRIDELEQSLSGEKAALRAAAAGTAERETEIARLRGELASSHTRNSKLASLLDEGMTRASRLEQDFQEAQRTAERLGESAATNAARAIELEAELAAATPRVAQLATSLGQAKGQLKAIERKVTWRLLSPFRWMTDGFEERANCRLIEGSGVFDRKWYIEKYPQTAALDPVLDYLQRGGFEGRDPSPLFDSDWYLEQNLEVRDSGVNPLVHFLRHGGREGRDPSPLFDSDWYLSTYADVGSSGTNPLVHYVNHGAAEGRDPSPDFNARWYLTEYRDVKAAGFNPLAHYLEYGAAEGRKPNPAASASLSPAGNGGVQRDSSTTNAACLPPTPLDRYATWLACNVPAAAAERTLRAALASRHGRLPRISVIMPVFNTPGDLLDRAISSVRKQIYDGWELCIADDASIDPAVAQSLLRWSSIDDRIRVVRRDRNGGIAAATNSAVSLAGGEFLAFLDHDDLLSPDALAEVAIHAADHPNTDIIYSDDDKIDTEGRRFDPQFKPDWSPTLLLSYMYLSHLLVVRRSLFEAIDGVREGFDGSQDYDLILRAAERARRVGHIPRVLYHWRVTPSSTASSGDAKPHSFVAGARAVADALARRGSNGTVSHPDWAKAGKVGMFATQFPDQGPRVSILIPTRNRLDLLEICVASLSRTTYRNFEIVIIDNESDDPATLAFLAVCGHRVVRISCPDGRFSFAHLNNAAARAVDSEFLLFLNNDTEVASPRWLSQMMGYARMSGVGAVGAKLMYRDGTVQHAGVVHGYHEGLPGHAFRSMPAREWGYLGYLRVAREWAAVTAACMLTPRALFLETGGFDETAFAVAYNDVDYCYRLSDGGYRCVVCPDAELVHEEGRSRGFADDPDEITAFRRRHGMRIDPYYSAHLSLDNEHFEIRPYRHPATGADGAVRVIAATHNLNHEGAPHTQFELIHGLYRQGLLKPTVISPQDGPLRADYEQVGIPVKIVTPLDTSSKAEFERGVDELARTFRELGPDVICASTLQTFWVIAGAHAAGIPAVWNVHESEPWQGYYEFLPPDVRTSAYRCFAYPYRVVFGSRATRRVWEPLNDHHNFTAIYNGLDIDRVRERAMGLDRRSARASLGLGDGEIAVTLLGTVCGRKGQLDLVRAIRLLPNSIASGLRVYIVGDRPNHYSFELHAEANSLAASSRVRLEIVPETGEPMIYLQASDIAVCSSRLECYPRVVMEKMHFGLPVITTPVFGIVDQVRENVNGLFYAPGDVDQLAAHLTRLITDAELRDRLGANGPRVLRSMPSLADTMRSFDRIFREARRG